MTQREVPLSEETVQLLTEIESLRNSLQHQAEALRAKQELLQTKEKLVQVLLLNGEHEHEIIKVAADLSKRVAQIQTQPKAEEP